MTSGKRRRIKEIGAEIRDIDPMMHSQDGAEHVFEETDQTMQPLEALRDL